MNENKNIKRDLYFGAKLRNKAIDDMIYVNEIDKWVNVEEVIKDYYEN